MQLLLAAAFAAALAALVLFKNSTETHPQLSGVITEAEGFSISGFEPMTNWPPQGGGGAKTIFLDYTDAYKGFMIPSIRQTKDGAFEYSFDIENTSDQAQKFRYKIFYQNESYKFPEVSSDSSAFNPLAAENFYGSWLDRDEGFRLTEAIPADGAGHQVTGQITLAGDPRKEPRYAKWGESQRQWRNPRVGEYSFLLVVMTEEAYQQLPEPVKIISKTDENQHYIHPYWYFIHGKGKEIAGTTVMASGKKLKVIANPDPGKGVFISQDYYLEDQRPHIPTHEFRSGECGWDSTLFKEAAFQQFIHYWDPKNQIKNISRVIDWDAESYTKDDYDYNRMLYPDDEKVNINLLGTMVPCENIYSYADQGKIVIQNPASDTCDWKKENVGVVMRHGLTYGKFRAKVKFPPMLNADNIWNGLTYAIWLINVSNEEWNNRRVCEGGYRPKMEEDVNVRVKTTPYSEIDFEILKTVPYCPEEIYPPEYEPAWADPNNPESWKRKQTPLEKHLDDYIFVACTNWDMACPDPSEFDVGCHANEWKGRKFENHRWDQWYRALTQKYPEKAARLFAQPYYYEIEWKPTEIIWRIGPSPSQMYVVGYMDSSITTIPNNQMHMTVTSEYHNTDWWPFSPYEQQYIPFTGKPLKTEVLEVWVE